MHVDLYRADATGLCGEHALAYRALVRRRYCVLGCLGITCLRTSVSGTACPGPS